MWLRHDWRLSSRQPPLFQPRIALDAGEDRGGSGEGAKAWRGMNAALHLHSSKTIDADSFHALLHADSHECCVQEDPVHMDVHSFADLEKSLQIIPFMQQTAGRQDQLSIARACSTSCLKVFLLYFPYIFLRYTQMPSDAVGTGRFRSKGP